MNTSLPAICLARHGKAAWTISRQHTGRTDIPLLRQGEKEAVQLGQRPGGLAFAKALVSPLGRAPRTCELAGLSDKAEADPELHKWDYGDYEGRRTADIRQERPGRYLFRDGCPGGESIAAIGTRAERGIARLRTIDGHVLLFSHGHFLRVLAARWLGLSAGDARLFVLSKAGLSLLDYEHNLDEAAILLWNDNRHVLGEDVAAVQAESLSALVSPIKTLALQDRLRQYEHGRDMTFPTDFWLNSWNHFGSEVWRCQREARRSCPWRHGFYRRIACVPRTEG
jgi:broad specificity phosphatase PhoE